MTGCNKIFVAYKIAQAKVSNIYLYFLMKNENSKKWAKGTSRPFAKEYIKMPSEIHEKVINFCRERNVN